MIEKKFYNTCTYFMNKKNNCELYLSLIDNLSKDEIKNICKYVRKYNDKQNIKNICFIINNII